jgi:hypothetical protein
MMIASKLHDLNPMKAERFTYLSADSYTELQIVDMEQNICSTLRFHLHIVTSCHFVHRFLRASHVSGNQYNHQGPSSTMMQSPPPCSFQWNEDRMRFMVDYLLEISMLEIDFVAMKPSLVAAGAIYLARATLDIHDTTPPSSSPLLTSSKSPTSIFSHPSMTESRRKHNNSEMNRCTDMDTDTEQDLNARDNYETYGYFSQALTFYTGYNVKDLINVVTILHRAHKKYPPTDGSSSSSSTLTAVYDKYVSTKYKSVAWNLAIERKKLFPESLVEFHSSSEDDSDSDTNISDSDTNISDSDSDIE